MASAPRARALVIGVSETEFRAGAFPRLSGVASDVALVTSMLANRGFATTVPMKAEDLSADAVAAALVGLVDATDAGDLSVIYLTGHGYQMPDASGDEADRWDEAFVCADRPIRDDWFREELWSRTRSGAKIVTVADACHSESIATGITAPDPAPAPVNRLVPADGYYRLVLAACRDYQDTLDLGPSDKGGGVATKWMLSALDLGPITYRDLWASVATNVTFEYSQDGMGTPVYDSRGPSDDLLDAIAFRP